MSIRIYIVGRPQLDVQGFSVFLHHHQTNWQRTLGATNSEEMVEAAGRVCYMSFGPKQSPRSTSEYIKNLIVMGHESVLEHVNWSFVLAGVSRSLTHQLVRHRVGFSYSQLSQQYHDECEANFVIPSDVEANPRAYAAWRRATNVTKKAYKEILQALQKEERHNSSLKRNQKENLRALRSAARSVLPNCTETIVFMTANARALRHFLSVRGNIVGDIEMRHLAVELLRCLKKEAPALFFDYEIHPLPNGTQLVKKVNISCK